MIIDCLRLLLQSDCWLDIDECPILLNGHGPLHVAAETENVEAVKLLLQHKADVTAVDKCGQTPLFRAFSPAVAELLLDAGADVNATDTDKDAMTPLMWQFQALIEAYRPTREDLSQAALTAKQLLLRGPVRVKEAFRLAVTLGITRNCTGHGSCAWNGLYACRIYTEPCML